MPVTHLGFLSSPTNIQTFALEEDRERLTPPALKGIKKLARAWALTRDETAKLLAISPSKWDRIVDNNRSTQALNQDQLTRISSLVGIFKGLHLLFANNMADRWPKLGNSGPLFQFRTPVETMIGGGIPVMLDVRRHIDALRGGL